MAEVATVKMDSFTKRVRTILVRNGLLDDAKADEVLKQATDENRSFCQVLFDKKMVDERLYLGALSEETNLPPVDLARVQYDEEALQHLQEDMAKSYCVLPIAKISNILTVAVADPFDPLKLDDLRLLTGCDIRPVISHEPRILEQIKKAYNPGDKEIKDVLSGFNDQGMQVKEQKEEDDDMDLVSLKESASDSPVIKLVNLLVFQGIKDGASDIHIEPFEKRIRVRYRVDGILHESISPPKKMLNPIISRIKILADLDIAERRKPQDGKFQLRMEGRQIDFRVSILPTIHGEKCVMRVLDSSSLALSLDSLGFEPKSLSDFRAALAAPYGMILVTGPTGSGKSTSLYSSLKEILSIDDNVVTVEDPVEYQLDGVNQVAVNPKRGITFATALRSILRQDPDIIMVGEIRDMETVEIAVKAALTGHLVLSTLHTNDSSSTITRLIDMGVDPFLVASSVILVSAQRLARKLCEKCKEPVVLPPERLLKIGFTEEDLPNVALMKPVGCKGCKDGYKGRFALLETILVNDRIRKLIIDGASALDIKKIAMEQGMVTLRRAGLMNALRGKTSIEEILRSTMGDEGIAEEIQPAKGAKTDDGKEAKEDTDDLESKPSKIIEMDSEGKEARVVAGGGE